MTRIRRSLTGAVLAAGLAAPAFADPPPWAPAWGRRAHHEYEHEREHEHGRYRHHRERHHAVVVERPRYVVVPERGPGTCHRQLVSDELIGTVLGGAAGAGAGTQVGKGNGQIAAVIAGTILGGLLGGSVGRSMDRADVQCVGQALEYAPTGQPIAWHNPNEGAAYTVTPMRTYQSSDGRYCREFQESVIIDGRRQLAHGTACRQPDGAWQIQN